VGNENQIPTPEQDAVQTVGSFIWELIKIFVIALAIIIPFRLLVAEPFIVSGHSMDPTFADRQYLIVDKMTYRFREPVLGDVIVLRYPRDPQQFFIKRIIGVPGDTVRIDQGRVIVSNKENPQGVTLDEPYLPSQTITFGRAEPLTLGANEFYVMGDNRQASSDSRVWGVLPRKDIVGKAWLRVFPLSEFGIIHAPKYSK
jgi:signal peptidase I